MNVENNKQFLVDSHQKEHQKIMNPDDDLNWLKGYIKKLQNENVAMQKTIKENEDDESNISVLKTKVEIEPHENEDFPFLFQNYEKKVKILEKQNILLKVQLSSLKKEIENLKKKPVSLSVDHPANEQTIKISLLSKIIFSSLNLQLACVVGSVLYPPATVFLSGTMFGLILKDLLE